MKLFNVTDLDGFFAAVDKCKGRVELVTSEGDRLNLKSKLCQYVAFANVISGGEIAEMEILASEPEDTAILAAYVLKGIA